MQFSKPFAGNNIFSIQIFTYGVMHIPALVVNEQVVSMGKVLKTADVVKLLSEWNK